MVIVFDSYKIRHNVRLRSAESAAADKAKVTRRMLNEFYAKYTDLRSKHNYPPDRM
jgi:hypothetical protein